jgi:2-hydroxychromene-2-carboxylate isomerase
MSAAAEPVPAVDVHIDLMCPYAFQTSRWLRNVRAETGLELRWRFFSLEEVNRAEGRKHPWERAWSYGWSMMRIGALLRRRDMDLLDRWYVTAGAALHVHGRKPHRPEVARALLVEMGEDPTLVDAALDDPTTHDEVRADHERVLALGGWGVPTLVLPADAAHPDEHALFGPVLIDPPEGAAAVRLWELVVGWRAFPHVFELQQPKRREHLEAIAEAFRPYFEARDWETVQNPTP